jgi:hypothetical protein
MATTPKYDSIEFCLWLLTNRWLKITPAQRNLATIVKAAAESGTQVTTTQWKDFLNAFAWRYKWYLMNQDLATFYDDDAYYYNS